ncbi:CDC23 protein, partial [Polyodon spathula]|nr:CDC23 protein [Polyodon spathula]
MAALSSEFGDLVEIKKQLTVIIALCRDRGLMHIVKWASELAFAFDPRPMKELPPPPPFIEVRVQWHVVYQLINNSAIGIADNSFSNVIYAVCEFAGFFRNVSDVVAGPLEKGQVKNIPKLTVTYISNRNINCFRFSVTCIVFQNVLLHIMFFLLVLFQLKSMSFPDTWIKDFFLAHICTEMQMIEEALQKYQSLINIGFSKSTYIISQIAVAFHNIRDIDKALSMFNELREQDPYRIKNMDTFSNLLYVRTEWRVQSGDLLCDWHAIEVNKRDYRAWYGLGQTFEIRKMPFYCLYYYRRAHQVRLSTFHKT